MRKPHIAKDDAARLTTFLDSESAAAWKALPATGFRPCLARIAQFSFDAPTVNMAAEYEAVTV